MQLGFVDSEADLQAMAGEWEDLAARSPAHIFQTHSFLSAWHRHVGMREGASLAIVTHREHFKLVGIFPACVVNIGAIRVLTWLGGLQVIDYGDVLYDQSAASLGVDDFVFEALTTLRGRGRHSVAFFPNVRRDALAFGALSTRLLTHGNDAAPCVPIPGDFETYLGSLTQRMRHEVRRRVRRLGELGEVDFRVVGPHEPEHDHVMTALIDQKRRRFAAPGAKSVLHRPGYEAFYREQSVESPWAHLSCLTLDGQVIAAHFGYLHKDRLYLLLTSFDESYAAYSPGKVLIYHLLKECTEQEIDLLDFCLGDESYKSDWAHESVQQTSFVSDDVPGHIFAAAAGLRRRGAQRLARRGKASR